MNNNYLEHHGIKGMKWYERRFQNKDGSLTPAGRSRYGVGKPRVAVVAKKLASKITGSDEEKSQRAEKQQLRKEARMERRQQRKEARAEKAAAKEEQQKQKILQSGDANLILENVKRFSNQEIQEGLNRARNINAVKQMQSEQAFSRIEGAVSKFAKIANTGLSAVSTVENIRNGIDKIKSWGEEKDFIGKTPEELLDSAKDLSTAGMKKLTDRLNSIVSATRNVNEINTSGLKSELEKLKTFEEIRKARETYKENLNGKKKNDWRDEIWKETPENILKNIENGKYKTEDQLKVAVEKLTLVGNASNNMTKLGVALEKFKPKTVPQPAPTNPPNPSDDKNKEKDRSSGKTADNTQDSSDREQEKKSEETASKPKESTKTSSSSQQTSNNTSQPSKPTFTQSNNKSQLIQPSKPPENANNNRSNLFNGSKSEKDRAWENLGKAMEQTYGDDKISKNEKAMERAKERAKSTYQMSMNEAAGYMNKAFETFFKNRYGYKET